MALPGRVVPGGHVHRPGPRHRAAQGAHDQPGGSVGDTPSGQGAGDQRVPADPQPPVILQNREGPTYRCFVIVSEAQRAATPSGRSGHGLKYRVARRADGDDGEALYIGDDTAEVLTSCGRFVSDLSHGRTFASDREADRMVERLASGLPVFTTRAAAVAATVGVVLPAWLAVLL